MYGGHPEDIDHTADIKVFTIFHHSNHIFPHARLPFSLSFHLFPIMPLPPKSRHSSQRSSSCFTIFHLKHAFLRKARLLPNPSIIPITPSFPYFDHITTSRSSIIIIFILPAPVQFISPSSMKFRHRPFTHCHSTM